MLGIRGLWRAVGGRVGLRPERAENRQGRAGTMNGVGRTAASRAIRVIGALCLVVLLVGCGEIDGSGAEGLAAQKVLQAAIESLDSGKVVNVK